MDEINLMENIPKTDTQTVICIPPLAFNRIMYVFGKCNAEVELGKKSITKYITLSERILMYKKFMENCPEGFGVKDIDSQSDRAKKNTLMHHSSFIFSYYDEIALIEFCHKILSDPDIKKEYETFIDMKMHITPDNVE